MPQVLFNNSWSIDRISGFILFSVLAPAMKKNHGSYVASESLFPRAVTSRVIPPGLDCTGPGLFHQREQHIVVLYCEGKIINLLSVLHSRQGDLL